MERRGLLVPEVFLTRICCSLGCHIINFENLAASAIKEGGLLRNERVHIVYMTISGMGKSFLFRVLLDEKFGLLSKTDIPTRFINVFTPESWIGTINKLDNGTMQKTCGVFAKYKAGIVCADDYMRLKALMDGTGLSNDEVYLMTALDYESASKYMAYDELSLQNIGMTFWAGMRPTKLNLTSGLARRFSFQIFLPTRAQAHAMKQAARNTVGKDCDEVVLGHIRDKIREVRDNIKRNMLSEYDYKPVHDWSDKYDVPPFEEKLFCRLALGYSVATDRFPHIVLDDILLRLFRDELNNRDILRRDPLMEAIVGIVKAEGKMKESELTSFLSRYYQMNEFDIERYINMLCNFRKVLIRDNGNIMAA